MTPHEPGSHRGIILALLATVLGAALGAAGLVLLRPFDAGAPARPAATATAPHGTAWPGIASRAVYARVAPSVVDITATLRYDGETASGTGFVIDPRAALVITNNHVIRDSTSVTVTVPTTGRSYPATIVGADVTADIAVLQIGSVPGIAKAPLGNSATVSTGTPVVAIGNQAGANRSPARASGVISGTGKTIQAVDGATSFTETLHGMLATTARIKPGDSGGPLADAAGAVIGIDTAAGTDGSTAGYAIPINTAMIAERKIIAGRPGSGMSLGTKGFLGVIVGSTSVPSPHAQAARERRPNAVPAASGPSAGCMATRAGAGVPSQIAPARSGALVDGVLCHTAAAMAGIAAGDVITRVNGRAVGSPEALSVIVSESHPGAVVTVTWVAVTGATRTSRVRLDPAPAA